MKPYLQVCEIFKNTNAEQQKQELQKKIQAYLESKLANLPKGERG